MGVVYFEGGSKFLIPTFSMLPTGHEEEVVMVAGGKDGLQQKLHYMSTCSVHVSVDMRL